jgi:hypothetical protein
MRSSPGARTGHNSHCGPTMEAKKRAVATLDAPVSEGDSPQKSPHSAESEPLVVPN